MGATWTWDTAEGKTAKEAFEAAQNQARYDYGHQPYSGTLSEKDSFGMAHLLLLPLKEAVALAEKHQGDSSSEFDEKWGPAGCIEIETDQPTRTFLFFGWCSA